MNAQHFSRLTSSNKKKIAVLIDPDRTRGEQLTHLCKRAEVSAIDMFLVGGSILWNRIDETITTIKEQSSIPVYIFPGSVFQICSKADGILFLSLISGRNPEYLIGQQVIAAPILKNTTLEIIPTGYILVESGRTTAVEYMSNTKPIPANKPELVAATAIAGEMMGQKLIYIEGGSGADASINKEIISQVRCNISIPIMVGGGIRSIHEISSLFAAGADIVVLGTIIEENPEFLTNITTKESWNIS